MTVSEIDTDEQKVAFAGKAPTRNIDSLDWVALRKFRQRRHQRPKAYGPALCQRLVVAQGAMLRLTDSTKVANDMERSASCPAWSADYPRHVESLNQLGDLSSHRTVAFRLVPALATPTYCVDGSGYFAKQFGLPIKGQGNIVALHVSRAIAARQGHCTLCQYFG